MTLLEEGIRNLREQTDRQCIGVLRKNGMVCVEGIFAEILIREFPERFSWFQETDGFSMLDKDSTTPGWPKGRAWQVLQGPHWRLLHPFGSEIIWDATSKYNEGSLAALNDELNMNFVEIADLLDESLRKFSDAN